MWLTDNQLCSLLRGLSGCQEPPEHEIKAIVSLQQLKYLKYLKFLFTLFG